MALTVQSATTKDRRTAKEVPLFQHRHFAYIAATLAEIKDGDMRYEMVQHFGAALRKTNPSFDLGRFILAAKAESLSLPVSVLTDPDREGKYHER